MLFISVLDFWSPPVGRVILKHETGSDETVNDEEYLSEQGWVREEKQAAGRGGGGGWGRWCAAQQGVVFAPLSLEQGLQILISLWNRVLPIPTLENSRVRATFSCQNRAANELIVVVPARVPLHTQARHFQFEGKLHLTFCNRVLYFQHFVLNMVAKLCLFSLERRYRHPAAHRNPYWGQYPPPGVKDQVVGGSISLPPAPCGKLALTCRGEELRNTHDFAKPLVTR